MEASHALMQATIESATDAILATDEDGSLTVSNRRFDELWQTSARSANDPIRSIANQMKDPDAYVRRLDEILATAQEETHDLLELSDGRTVERTYRAQKVEGRAVGGVWTFRDISDRVKAEEVSSRLAAIIESSDDAIISKTLKGIIITWNKGAERIFGYTAQEVIGKPIEILIPPERLEEEPLILGKLKAGERLDHFETVRVRKDGTRLDISLCVSPVRDAKGRVIGVSKIARDITERKRTEQALRDEAQVLEFVNKTGRSITAQLDLEVLVQLVTDTATEITGAQFGAFFYNKVDHAGETLMLYTLSGASRDKFESFDLPRNTPVFNPTFRGEAVVRSADITKDPRYGTMAPHFGMPKGHLPVRSYLAVPVRTAANDVIGGLFFGHSEPDVFNERAENLVVAIAAQAAIAIDNAHLYEAAQRELAERSRVESALRESEEHLRAMFSQAAIGIAEADLDGKFTGMNSKFCEILGYSAEELGRLTFMSITHPADIASTKKYISELMAGKIPHQVTEKRYIRKDQSEVWCLTTVTLIKDAKGNPLHYVGVIEDITPRKEADAARQALLESEREARKEAEKLSRLKDEFLATLSHELRTPLNAILGWTHLIGKYGSDQKMVSEGIEVIDRNAKLQAQLVSDLLDMSRVISGKMRLDVQEIQLPVLIEAALDSVRPAAEGKGVRIESILDPIGDPVHGDPSRLQQIIWNLLSNAVKFTPKGGKVQVVLRRVDSNIEISVSDTGKGIRKEFLPYLFERFSQQDSSAAREHGGLGIGLALVKQMAEMHGGKVHAYSAGENQGATFIVSMPLAITHAPRDGSKARSHPKTHAEEDHPTDLPDLSGLCILAVDDEPDARGLLKRILEDAGAKVSVAGSADEALAILQSSSLDLLISDIGMPGKDGYQFIKQVREAGHTLPATALTAFARSSDRTRALMAGFQAHVGKPVEPLELLVTVASLVGRAAPKQ